MKRTVAAIFAISILGASMFLAHAYKTRGDRKGNVSVTGLGSIDFESDEILWSGIFETTDADLAQAFEAIRADRKVVEEYLLEKGVAREEITFQQVNTEDLERSKYNDDGKYVGSEFEAYRLSQVVTIDSKDLDLIINISRVLIYNDIVINIAIIIIFLNWISSLINFFDNFHINSTLINQSSICSHSFFI